MEPETNEKQPPEIILAHMSKLVDDYYDLKRKLNAAIADEALMSYELSNAVLYIETGGLWLKEAYSQCASRVIFDKEPH